MSRLTQFATLLVALLLATPAALADEFDAGEFMVHYVALSTMDLTPAIAAQYGIARDPNRGLLNVTVLRKKAGTTGIPVPAQVTVTAVTSANQFIPVVMRRIDEPPSVYSIGELTVGEGDAVNFEFTVFPEGAKAPIRLRLQHQFFSR